jgi:DNA-binding winged helix-turn-helix (wHTH) protein
MISRSLRIVQKMTRTASNLRIPLLVSAAALAGVVGFVVDHPLAVDLIRETQSEARASATAFAQAAAGWLRSETGAYLGSVIDLMLLGSVAYVQITDSTGSTLVDRRRESWTDTPLIDRSPSAGTTVFLWRPPHSATVADVVVSVDLTARASPSARGVVRVGYVLDLLASRLRNLHAAAAASAAGGWLIVSLGIAWAVRAERSGARSVEPSGNTDGRRASALVVDEAAHHVTLCAEAVELRPKPYQLLCLLVGRCGEALSEEAILAELWPDSRFADSGDVRQCVYLLRRSLDAVRPKAGRCIVNVKSYGYRFDEERLRALCSIDSQDILEGGEHV